MSNIRRLTLVLAAAIVGAAFGVSLSLIPSPTSVHDFWASNLAAPWIILIFCMGWVQRQPLWGAFSGAAAGVLAIFGFYAQFLLQQNRGPNDPVRKSIAEEVQANLPTWLPFVAPWILVGFTAGIAYGFIGGRWGDSRTISSILLIAFSIALEPVGWRIYIGYFRDPWILWIVEPLFGATLIIWAWRNRGRQQVTPTPGATGE